MADKRKITTRVVEALPPGGWVWDTAVNGFCVRRQKSEARVYMLGYRIHGRQRWFTIGQHGSPWTCDTARDEALRLLGEVARGNDPANDRDHVRGLPTVAEAAERFMAEYVATKCKPSTGVGYRIVMNKHVIPRLGRQRIDTLTPADIGKLHHQMRDTPGQANRTLAFVSKFMSWCERAGLRDRGSNPVKGQDRFKENKRERFLTTDEIGRLGDALAAAEAKASRHLPSPPYDC